MIIYPALDLRDGRCVRLVEGDFSRETVFDADPAAAGAHVHQPGYAPVPPFNIYCWTLGFGASPHAVAARYRHDDVLALLEERSSSRVLLRAAIFANDARRAKAILASEPSLFGSLPREEHGSLAFAIFHGAFDAAHLLLDLGFDPSAPGVDGATALHTACWLGNLRLVDRILDRLRDQGYLGSGLLDAPDPTHRSPPLGWTAYGSVQRRAPDGDYLAVAERLVAAGADIHAVGNLHGRSLIEMANGNPEMQDQLRTLGAE